MPRVVYSTCDYDSERFVLLRLAEKSRFPVGREVETTFTGRHPLEGYAMARRAAMVYAGILLPNGKVDTFPFVSEIGPYRGRVLGSRSADGRQGWRIDFDPATRRLHVNWWDRRLDPRGDRDKSKHLYGANFVTDGTQDLFWEIESHFPGQVEPRAKSS